MLQALNPLSGQIINAAMEVHSALGPGLLESAYQTCLAHEFSLRGYQFQAQMPLPVNYKSVRLDCGYRMDFVVFDKIIVEIKAVEAITDVHEAQCLTYLHFSRNPLCLLLNFNTKSLKDGIRRFAGRSENTEGQKETGHDQDTQI